MKLKNIFKAKKMTKQDKEKIKREKEAKKQQEILKQFEDRDSCF